MGDSDDEQPLVERVTSHRRDEKSDINRTVKTVSFLCYLCGKEFIPEIPDLETHISSHGKHTPCSCGICNKQSAGQKDLLRHTPIHENCTAAKSAINNSNIREISCDIN